jgi:plastocyanin
MIRRLLQVTAVLLACTAVTVAAASGAQRGRKPATHTITITGMQYTPATLTIKPGDTVVWVNKDIVAHTATSTTAAFNSKMIPPEKSWKMIFKTKGDYPYVCSYHPTMKGQLTVQ